MIRLLNENISQEEKLSLWNEYLGWSKKHPLEGDAPGVSEIKIDWGDTLDEDIILKLSEMPSFRGETVSINRSDLQTDLNYQLRDNKSRYNYARRDYEVGFYINAEFSKIWKSSDPATQYFIEQLGVDIEGSEGDDALYCCVAPNRHTEFEEFFNASLNL